ncbi:GNAT family N-acetyltransferase [Prevotella sp. 10(H)]|uniref:GNAT family N-acetyltransferase n=1 Tax=Prevotella sp. 10(H) TaxID=1158294 RepID=UPI0004A71730|nr:GNAT family N-acetyltransferase [Prevotella sp. 10(H)]
MNIVYKNIQTFNPQQLQNLFLSVEWSSGQYPDKLAIAMQHSSLVFSAWDGEDLIGLISSMDDSIMNAYIHYLLINPKYQGKGIGKELLRLTTEHYKDYLRIILIAYDKETGFYKHCGFEAGEDKIPMFITSLWT